MDPSAVVLRYNPERWAELGIDTAADEESTPSKIVTFSYTKPGAQIQSSMQAGQPQVAVPRKRHLVPLSASSFERPVSQSLHNLAQYSQIMKSGSIPVAEAEENWYSDLVNVGQRLKFLRDTFKVIQSVRKRKMMGERADFRTLYDAKVSRTGSPSLSDEEMRTTGLSDDEENGNIRVANAPADSAMATPSPMSRRGRPRKRRGRERRNPFGRAEMAAAAANAKRTRASRRILDTPSSVSPAPSRETTPNPVTRRRGRRKATSEDASPESPSAEPQGPPLMHSPPILPSQRLSLVKGIPPYRHLPGYKPPVSLPSQSKTAAPTKDEEVVKQKSTTPQPFLPSQASFSGPRGQTGGFLPSQSSLSNIVPFQFQPYNSNSNSNSNSSPQVPPVQPPSSKPALRPAYSGSYASPANYANYTPAVSYSSGPNQPNLHKQPVDSGESPLGSVPKPVNLITSNTSIPPIKSATTLGSIAQLGSGPSRAPVFPRLAPQVATPAHRFSTWQSSFSGPGQSSTTQPNIVLPKIHALDKDMKPWSTEYKAPGSKEEHN